MIEPSELLTLLARKLSGSVMINVRLGTLTLLVGLAFSGCATGNLEEDAFFNRGWIRPWVLDRPTRHSDVTDSVPPER